MLLFSRKSFSGGSWEIEIQGDPCEKFISWMGERKEGGGGEREGRDSFQ